MSRELDNLKFEIQTTREFIRKNEDFGFVCTQMIIMLEAFVRYMESQHKED